VEQDGRTFTHQLAASLLALQARFALQHDRALLGVIIVIIIIVVIIIIIIIIISSSGDPGDPKRLRIGAPERLVDVPDRNNGVLHLKL